jgi:HlyD family secretion protein
MFKNKRIRNWWIAGIITVLAVFLAIKIFSPATASASMANTEEKAILLKFAETVEASGSLEARPYAGLTWKTDGVVEEVYVKAGDAVKAGDVLMKLKTTTVASSIISAQADLATAKKELDDLLRSSDTDLAQAIIDLRAAQEVYDKADDYLVYLQSSQKVPQTESRAYLETKRNAWMYIYKTKTFKGPAPEDWIIEAENDLALKKAQLDDAQYTYDRLKDGPNVDDITVAQARVDAAQATVDSMSIIAPFDGNILYVESQPGDLVSSGMDALNVADLDHLYVETQVDESDIASVQEGKQAEITLDALPGESFTGKVAAVNPVGEDASGLVKYVVRIDLDPVGKQLFLPLGTTANVVIHVKEATESLAVPITTIQNDGKGEFVMVLQSDGTKKRVDIVTGAIVGDHVVVSGDLIDGDRLQLNDKSSFNAPNPFGGGGQ